MISLIRNLENIKIIYGKEIRETLRDKRTLFLTLFLPVLLYPLLMLGMSQAVLLQIGKLQKEKNRVGICGEYSLLKETLNKDNQFEIVDIEKEKIEEYIRLEKIEIALEIPVSFMEEIQAQKNEPLPKIAMYYSRTSEKSLMAMKKVSALLENIHFHEMQERLQKIQKPASFVRPFHIAVRNISKAEEEGGFEFGKILSFLVVMMAVSFTLHPAIDMAAGEKERGTMETLLISSASRYEIVLGKYLAIFTIGMAGSLLNLASMGFTFEQFSGAINSPESIESPQKKSVAPAKENKENLQEIFIYESEEINQKQGRQIVFSISFSTILMILAILIPLLGLFSAISLVLSVFARTYKEAQYYLTPFMILVMPLAMMSLVPAVKLDVTKSLVPVLGVVLLYKELFMGQISWLHIGTVFLSTLFYASLALAWAVNLFQKEEVFCREGDSLRMELWNLKEKRQEVLSFSQALILFSLVMVLYYFLGRNFTEWNLLKGQIFTQIIFLVLVPIAVSFSYGLNFTKSFHLKKPKTIHFLAAIFIAVSGMMLSRELSILQRKCLFGSTKDLEQFAELLKPLLEGSSPLLLFLALSLTPGICEEFFFRGLLLSSLKKQQKPYVAVFWTATLFSLMHLNISNFSFYFVMGILLGVIVLHTDSIFPAMFAHILNNGLGLFGEPMFQFLGLWEVFNKNDAFMPVWFTGASIGVLALGIWILKK